MFPVFSYILQNYHLGVEIVIIDRYLLDSSVPISCFLSAVYLTLSRRQLHQGEKNIDNHDSSISIYTGQTVVVQPSSNLVF
jgi:hypothetical protein